MNCPHKWKYVYDKCDYELCHTVEHDEQYVRCELCELTFYCDTDEYDHVMDSLELL